MKVWKYKSNNLSSALHQYWKCVNFFELQFNYMRQLRDLLWRGCLSNLTELGHRFSKNASDINCRLLLETGVGVMFILLWPCFSWKSNHFLRTVSKGDKVMMSILHLRGLGECAGWWGGGLFCRTSSIRTVICINDMSVSRNAATIARDFEII